MNALLCKFWLITLTDSSEADILVDIHIYILKEKAKSGQLLFNSNYRKQGNIFLKIMYQVKDSGKMFI